MKTAVVVISETRVPEDILVNGVHLPGSEKPNALGLPGQLMPGYPGEPFGSSGMLQFS